MAATTTTRAATGRRVRTSVPSAAAAARAYPRGSTAVDPSRNGSVSSTSAVSTAVTPTSTRRSFAISLTSGSTLADGAPPVTPCVP
nr:hypothetical protein GCM10025730_29110 [Promicromonospora thailandica]